MTSFLPRKLPSRNWLIFWGTLGTASGSLAYDKYQLSLVRDDLRRRASIVAQEPLSPNDLPRKVIIYIEPTHWARGWFKDYAKPVLDAGALDYELVEPSSTARTSMLVRDALWDGKAEAKRKEERETLEAERKRLFYKSWGGWFTSFFFSQETLEPFWKVPNEDLGDLPPLPRFLAPKYNPETGILAVGPNVWRHVLLGLSEGSLSNDIPVTDVPKDESTPEKKEEPEDDEGNPPAPKDNTPISRITVNPSAWTNTSSDTSSDPDLPLPPVGFLTGTNMTGWTNFPFRIASYWNQRFYAKKIGEQVLEILFETTRPFHMSSDELLGKEDLAEVFVFKSEKNDDEETVQRKTAYHDRHAFALEYERIDPRVGSRLRVYSNDNE